MHARDSLSALQRSVADAALADRRRRKVARYDPEGRSEGSWEEEEELDDSMPLHDGRGNPCGHRPGFLISNDAASRSAKLKAQQDYTRDLENAWRAPNGTARDAEGYAERDIGTACTCKGDDYPADFGSPGTVRRVGSRIICVPDRREQPDPASDRRTVEQRVADHARVMADEYAAYDRRVAQQFRDPT
jgi:hypothetical protein